MGVNRDGSLVSRGNGASGQLGHGVNNHDTIDGNSTEPKIIDRALFSNNVRYVTCGHEHTCVLTTEGELYSW